MHSEHINTHIFSCRSSSDIFHEVIDAGNTSQQLGLGRGLLAQAQWKVLSYLLTCELRPDIEGQDVILQYTSVSADTKISQ